METQGKLHYYELKGSLLCGEPMKGNNWILNMTLITCQECRNILAKRYWQEFSDIPINNDDEIETEFQGFEVGTYRFDIWNWFENTFNVSINDNLMGTEET